MKNVDRAKIKVPFYMTDIDILHVASMHHIVIHHIDISIHIDEHPYLKALQGIKETQLCHIWKKLSFMTLKMDNYDIKE